MDLGVASQAVYREQEFVERCQCASPATTACDACGRARCAVHVDRGLCNRCTQAIGRELDRRGNRWWWTAGAAGTAVALGALILHVATAAVAGLPVGIATFFGLRAWERRQLIRRMGPALSASKGELAPAPAETPFPDAPPPPFIF